MTWHLLEMVDWIVFHLLTNNIDWCEILRDENFEFYSINFFHILLFFFASHWTLLRFVWTWTAKHANDKSDLNRPQLENIVPKEHKRRVSRSVRILHPSYHYIPIFLQKLFKLHSCKQNRKEFHIKFHRIKSFEISIEIQGCALCSLTLIFSYMKQ